ncbi:VOC family protein [Demequina litorisediminis]|uniref:Glyoxalase-like domain protein n=1 Tax=Demequina litorisediminis TaxID=1849022 RepID=A0ABQ6IAQ5_9MICO|nr:hypothetical protein [Demequina litorisediminis]GMA34153.1 hypothetical protein GCM10025876_03570 [Demequina litorisediminis]
MTVQRVSLVTLGVSDLARSRGFYEAWGWTPRQSADEIVFYQMDSLVVALFGLVDLAEDQGRADATLGTGAITLAQNYATIEEVDERFEAALAAGATEPEAARDGRVGRLQRLCGRPRRSRVGTRDEPVLGDVGQRHPDPRGPAGILTPATHRP